MPGPIPLACCAASANLCKSLKYPLIVPLRVCKTRNSVTERGSSKVPNAKCTDWESYRFFIGSFLFATACDSNVIAIGVSDKICRTVLVGAGAAITRANHWLCAAPPKLLLPKIAGFLPFDAEKMLKKPPTAKNAEGSAVERMDPWNQGHCEVQSERNPCWDEG